MPLKVQKENAEQSQDQSDEHSDGPNTEVSDAFLDDIALKIGEFGPAGAGKTFMNATFTSSPKAPLHVITGDPAAANTTLALFRPKLKDGSIVVHDPIVSTELGKVTKKREFKKAKRPSIDIMKTAYRIEDMIEEIMDNPNATIVFDNFTTYVKGLTAWMEKKAGTNSKTGQVMQMEWGTLYARVADALFAPFSIPTMTCIISAITKKVYHGPNPSKDPNFTKRVIQELDARWANEVEFYTNFNIEVRKVFEFDETELRQFIPSMPQNPTSSVVSFKKVRGWNSDPRYDRFYNGTYPNLREFLWTMGVDFYYPESGTILVPKKTRKGKRAIIENTYKGYKDEAGNLVTDDVYQID